MPIYNNHPSVDISKIAKALDYLKFQITMYNNSRFSSKARTYLIWTDLLIIAISITGSGTIPAEIFSAVIAAHFPFYTLFAQMSLPRTYANRHYHRYVLDHPADAGDTTFRFCKRLTVLGVTGLLLPTSFNLLHSELLQHSPDQAAMVATWLPITQIAQQYIFIVVLGLVPFTIGVLTFKHFVLNLVGSPFCQRSPEKTPHFNHEREDPHGWGGHPVR